MISSIVKSTRSAKRTLLSNARRMRHEPTDAESKFWLAVRARRFAGYKFRRQYPVGHYIADFVCLDHHLIIEFDGEQHGLQETYDAERTAYLETQGFRVLRYPNDEFLKNPNDILDGILLALEGKR